LAKKTGRRIESKMGKRGTKGTNCQLKGPYGKLSVLHKTPKGGAMGGSTGMQRLGWGALIYSLGRKRTKLATAIGHPTSNFRSMGGDGCKPAFGKGGRVQRFAKCGKESRSGILRGVGSVGGREPGGAHLTSWG